MLIKKEDQIIITEENGVTIVSNPAQPLYPNAEFIWEEELSIGEEDGDSNYVFYRAYNIVVDSKENIYVLDTGNHRVQVFNKEGSFLYSFGKKGEGPGEFQMPFGMCIFEDEKLYILDGQTRRVSIFKVIGEFINSFDIIDGSAQYLYLDDYENLYYAKSIMGKTPGDRTINVSKYNFKGDLLATFHEVSDNRMKIVRNGSNVSFIIKMFLPRTVWSVSSQGNLFSGLGDKYHIDVKNSEGKLMRTINREWQPISVTSDDKKDVLDQTQKLSTPMKNEVEFEDTKPAFSRFLVDDSQNLWIQLYTEFGEENKIYDVFNSEGKYIYHIKIPFSPTYFKNGKFYRIDRTEDGVELIKRYNYSWKNND
jgi:DNA-binding beta-propeller fold protein YncE